ncbi:hypothetical protein CARUB_v10022216mg [Capsella rubella]|uniref:RING-type E3 ubiquitin transferase n=2 Tax=Capsella rubella TaxID=81985 RepID=R0ID98_9BRAS|nr:hypothetical protein CARUB_v10022216mg [Capsella rubella]
MVKGTNSEQALVGETSSHLRRRQQVTSTVQDEAENVGGDVGARSGTLFKLDLLDCPVCCHALTVPIFQCDNGHIACSSCCTELRYRCRSCTFPIGNYRCRRMEKVVKSIIIPCPNAKHGCTETFSYGKELVHEKKCSFTLCYCPAPNCNYSGLYKDLYIHYKSNHMDIENQFVCGRPLCTWWRISEKVFVLQESADGPLVVLQRFNKPGGWYVTVNCIAPCAPGVGEFSYELSYGTPMGGYKHIMTFKSSEMNRIHKVSFQTPEKDFMLIPHYFQYPRNSLKMTICIKKDMKEEGED